LSDTGQRRVAKADSILLSYHPDTSKLRTPLARSEAPRLLAVGESYHWNRDQLFASGSLTLADLLSSVPGLVAVRGGWLSTPMLANYGGDGSRVRIFYDGLELDALNPQTRHVEDLATIELWSVEDVSVEVGADEIRVYLRSWSVDHTTPYSRADIFTGNEQTNLFRAFYGQRFGGGEALQIGAQQFTNINNVGGGGSGTSLFGRFGWANGPWSFDAVGDRVQRGMDPITRYQLNGALYPAPGLADFEGTYTTGYLRAGYGQPEHGVWAQLMASTQSFRNSSPQTATIDSATGVTLPGVPDTTASESQYVAAGGLSFGDLRVSGTERVRVFASHGIFSSPSARASLTTGPLALSVFLEGNAPTAWATLQSPQRVQTVPQSTESITARLTPLPFVSLLASANRTSSTGAPGAPPTAVALRGEAGFRVGQLWFAAGVMTRDTAQLQALSRYDTTYAPVGVGRATGTYGTIRGTMWNFLSADVQGISWGSSGSYRPQYEGRGQLSIKTEWLSHFPRHTFSFLASGVFEYQSAVPYPVQGSVAQLSTPAEVFSTLVEIRILQGTLSWQFRNLLGYQYYLVPGFIMPRQTSIYGIRWSFWN
jgi:hypothetical protein